MTPECAAHSSFAAASNCPLAWLVEAGTMEFTIQPSIFSVLCLRTTSACFNWVSISGKGQEGRVVSSGMTAGGGSD